MQTTRKTLLNIVSLFEISKKAFSYLSKILLDCVIVCWLNSRLKWNVGTVSYIMPSSASVLSFISLVGGEGGEEPVLQSPFKKSFDEMQQSISCNLQFFVCYCRQLVWTPPPPTLWLWICFFKKSPFFPERTSPVHLLFLPAQMLQPFLSKLMKETEEMYFLWSGTLFSMNH
jgi:hypothetical protein